ncbi:MAG: dihydrodipicolinate synthase family protein [Alkalispirochaeta sp.]
MEGTYTGMIPPMVVPFTPDGEIDETAFRSEARYLMKHKIHGISVGGSTGEGVLLSDEELRRTLEILQEVNEAKLPVFAGIIRNSTKEAIRAARDAEQLKADVLLVTPVFYHGATNEGNYAYFKAIAEATSLPIVIYNVVATNIISPELFLQIAEIEQIIGIKQVDPVKLAEIAVMADPDVLVYSACDQMLYGTYVSGARGSISALVTIAPQLCLDQWDAFLNGDQARAMEIQQKMVPIVRSYLQPPFPGKVKELINLQGRSGGVARMPNMGPDSARREAMRRALMNAGMLS